MDYRFTDTDETPIRISLTLTDIRRIRAALAHVLADDNAESAPRYAAQDFDAFLVTAIGKAADAMEVDARCLRRRIENENV